MTKKEKNIFTDDFNFRPHFSNLPTNISRNLCSAAEDRNTVLIQDVEANQSKLGEEHNSIVSKVEREWKERLDKSKSMLQNEIEFLDASLNRQVTFKKILTTQKMF